MGAFHARASFLLETAKFSPRPGADARIARDPGYCSLLVVTYWGHVSRVRMYFEQCFDAPIYVTDTPRPTPIARQYALLHETGG